MATTESVKSLDDPGFKAELQRLRRTDNLTNWYYIARTYLYLAAVIGGAVWVFELARTDAISFWWTVPTALAAVALVGAGQHQLSGLAHEGVHHILFRSRYLNDLASDLLTMFPLFSATHLYRLQHLAHHQFVNDPDRDPDVSQLRTSGHWLDFPVSPRVFLRTLARQMWVPKLVRFMRVRARYNATGADHSPYLIKGHTPSRTAVRIGLLYILSLIVSLTALYYVGDPVLLVAVPVALWAVVSVVYWRLPADKFIRTRLHPVIPARYMTILRLGFVTALFTTLAVITKLTGAPAALYYFLLWVVPMFTSFSFFMILRQIVQHGNADRGWMTNTRTFLVGRAINFAVFPMGQDYHLPHHMYATIPHYRLRRLHELLMQYPEYHECGVEVKGYFFATEYPKAAPTVLDVLGPEYSARHTRAVHIDDTVLDNDRFDDAEQIRQTGEQLRRSAG
ncbi:MAG TPA: fatty acid desaturase [Fimbriiglobus sp.]|nr:fatty acid desaturase [Fimbriiglobus sp.]